MTIINSDNLPENAIAIIGMACRYPKANNIDEFWQNLREGIEALTVFSDQELIDAGVDAKLLTNPNFIKSSMILKDIDLFDANFFGFNPRQAELLDPQHRLFLECVWQALEHAGYDPEQYKGRIGVFSGADISRYLLSNILPNADMLVSLGLAEISSLGNNGDYMPTQASYRFNLTGPSVNIQTACSTSLVSTHMACQSLLNYESDMALAGGVAITLLKKAGGYLFKEGSIFSIDGHCRAFDSRSSGTISGSGAGIVVLKRLADAIADGDNIYAMILGSAINNDGSDKVNYNAPSVDGQAKVIIEALGAAGVNPETISYVEAHGTGTNIGDPIEIRGLTKAYRAMTKKKGYCAIGSVKTNIGHLNSGAGVAGLIKTTLSLHNKTIPASLNYQSPNPKIDFENSPFFVNNQRRDWEVAPSMVRRAGLSSFGYGGTNAHAILEEAPPLEPSTPSTKAQLLIISARTETALESATQQLVAHLKAVPETSLADIAYTLQVGRKGFEYRRMVACSSVADAIKALDPIDYQRVFSGKRREEAQALVFMFPGGGAQHIQMGAALYQTETVFRQHVDQCIALLTPSLGKDLLTSLYPTNNIENAVEQMNRPSLALPLLFTVEYALAKLWMDLGLAPTAMIGHSLGEYVAACLAGVFSLADALAIVVLRGRLFETLPKGAMLSVPLSEADLLPYLKDGLSIAAINSPSLCVVSGYAEAIQTLAEQLTQEGIDCHRLHIDTASHSEIVNPIVAEFSAFINSLKLNAPKIPLISNFSGTWLTPQEATSANYWGQHLRHTVRFAEGISLLSQEEGIWLEVGPGRTLTMLARQNPHKPPTQVILASLPHPQDQTPERIFFLNSLGRLWLTGCAFKWKQLYANEYRRRQVLPSYPFERQHYWFEPERTDTKPAQVVGRQPDMADWFYLPSWKRTSAAKLLAKEDAKLAKNWLIFVDGHGIGAAIVARLRQAGQQVIEVVAGNSFVKLAKDSYQLDPAAATDYQQLLADCSPEIEAPLAILHLWSLNIPAPEQDMLARFNYARVVSCASLVFLGQALNHKLPNLTTYLTVVSNQMQEVNRGELVYPEKALLLGPVKVMPKEFAQVSCRSIDIILPSLPSKDGEYLLAQLIEEGCYPPQKEIIAYRGQQRWLQIFEQLKASKSESPLLKTGGVYLITGGLGGIALELAQHLAKTVQARLALLTRSDFLPREEWSAWLLNHEASDLTSQRILKLQEIEKVGGSFTIIKADVTNLVEVEAALAQAQNVYQKIDGIIHTANVLMSNSIIEVETLDNIARALQTKSQGAIAINQALKGQKLDFISYCSSITSIIGTSGMVSYCAANSFLDAFACYLTQTNDYPVMSVNWESWQLGSALKLMKSILGVSGELEELQQKHLEKGLTSAEGVAVFDRTLALALPQSIISTSDLEHRINHSITLSQMAEKASQSKIGLHKRPNITTPFVPASNWVEETLISIWQDILGIDQIGIEDNFFDLGGHSLTAIQIVSRIDRALSIKIGVDLIFKEPTIFSIASHILQKKAEEMDPEQLAALLAEEEDMDTSPS